MKDNNIKKGERKENIEKKDKKDKRNQKKKELLVQNETEYTYERYVRLNKFNMYKKQKAIFVILIISISILFLCGVSMLFFSEYYRAILYIAFAVIFLVFTILLPRVQVKKIFNSDNLLKNQMVNTYYFYDNKIEVKNKKSKSVLEFGDIYRVYETKSDFYIFLNKIQVFMISKGGFIKGDSTKLRELFKEKLDKKYVKKYRK